MGWARFDDQYTDNPKILEAGPWAELLDMRAIIYCARMETDGLISRAALKRISHGIPKAAERVTMLLEVGRWTVNEGGGWWIHDYLAYNPSKAQRAAERARGRERVAKHRSSTGGNAVTNAYQSKGTGEVEEKRSAPPFVKRCRRCHQVQFDCSCPPIDLVEDVG